MSPVLGLDGSEDETVIFKPGPQAVPLQLKTCPSDVPSGSTDFLKPPKEIFFSAPESSLSTTGSESASTRVSFESASLV